jgi:DNA ligase-1
MSTHGEPDFEYVVFDSFMLEGNYLTRIHTLDHEWVDRVVILTPTTINNEDEFRRFEDRCLLNGDEGVMVRNDGRYKFGRSGVKEGLLLKWKRFEDGEAEIRFFVEQMENTNPQEDDNLGGHKRGHSKAGKIPKGTLGAIEVTDIKTGVEFKIGTGFDNDLRQHVWDNPELYEDKIVKYKSQPFGEKDKPRFPTFLGWRDREDM